MATRLFARDDDAEDVVRLDFAVVPGGNVDVVISQGGTSHKVNGNGVL